MWRNKPQHGGSAAAPLSAARRVGAAIGSGDAISVCGRSRSLVGSVALRLLQSN
ncbi:MAG: hypothetical protein H9847_01180 [Candidatus Anaerobiospirillum pullicola]|uniref:Uncharacterized protein n=1 Tax=Candidatus Anaerobiospirillum pullicola TaxID=2838451 RepID=A0A948WY96_9GAMM|nr:hypothetical protein [Candidatus Anaerobiospirillum pullicola]